MSLLGFIFVVALSLLVPVQHAQAQSTCSVPNQITNGQVADATVIMGNFNALKDCTNSVSNSAVTPSGTPAAGNLSVFSAPKTVTNGDLSGDCTTAGTLTVTCTRSNGTPLGYFATGTDAGQLTGTVSANRFDNGTNADSAHFLRGDGTWSTPPSGGGAGGLPTIYSSRDSTVWNSGTVPVSETAFYSVTIPASSVARNFLLFGNIVWDANHGVRWTIMLDGTRVWPATVQTSNPGINSNATGDGSTIITISGVPVTVPGDGGSHTVSVAWQAQGSTAALTVRERSLYTMQVP